MQLDLNVISLTRAQFSFRPSSQKPLGLPSAAATEVRALGEQELGPKLIRSHRCHQG